MTAALVCLSAAVIIQGALGFSLCWWVSRLRERAELHAQQQAFLVLRLDEIERTLVRQRILEESSSRYGRTQKAADA